MKTAEQLTVVLTALADPTRRALLARLASGELGVMELAEPFEMSQPAISKHLKVLENAGLIHRRVDGSRRPCALAADGLAPIDQWLNELRNAMSSNYDRLDELLAVGPSEPHKEPPP